jgi:transcriptional regulator with XRE-family HTH domain
MASISFAGRLRELREAAGLTTYALAKRCGLTKQALYRLENGSSEPTWQTVQLLAVALGVDCRSFVDPTITPPPEEPAAPRGRPRKAAAAAEAAPPKKDTDLAKPPVKKTRKQKGG